MERVPLSNAYYRTFRKGTEGKGSSKSEHFSLKCYPVKGHFQDICGAKMAPSLTKQLYKEIQQEK